MASRPSFDEPPHARQPLLGQSASRTAGLRAVAALLATGGFALLTGGAFLLPFALSPYAIQNDVYMTNFFLAPLFILAGGICVLVGIMSVALSRGLRRHTRRLGTQALLLAVSGAAVVTVAYFLFGGRYYSVGPDAINWPPYLTMPLLLFAMAVGLVVCVVGVIWGASASSQAIQPGAAPV